MADTTNTDTTAASGAATLGEEQAFEAWYKMDCAVNGVGAKLAAKAAWHARAALAAPAAQEAEPAASAYRVLRRDHSGEWVHDGRHWVDGPAPVELVRDCEKEPERWRVENAYTRPPRPQADAGAAHAVWTRGQVEAFCAVALRNVQLVDELGPTLAEVRDGVAAALAAAPQATAAPTAAAAEQPGVAHDDEVLPLLVRDIANDLGRPALEVISALRVLGLGNYSVNTAVSKAMATRLRQHFEAPAPAAGAAPTDAEIDAVWKEGALRKDAEPSIRGQFRWAARAVLARWGAAAPAQEADAKKGGV